MVCPFYLQQVSINWKASNIYRQPTVQADEYSHNGIPPPPSPVQKVKISELQFLDDNIKFVFHWEAPLASNGQVINYMACLGGRQLQQYETYNPTAIDKNDTKCINISNVSIHI